MQRLPRFDPYRAIAGAAGPGWVDLADLGNAAYTPVGEGTGTFLTFDGSGFTTVLIYWDATGADPDVHTVTLQLMVRSRPATGVVTAEWVVQPQVALRAREIGEFPVHNAAMCAVRNRAQAAGGATNFRLLVTGGEEARRP